MSAGPRTTTDWRAIYFLAAIGGVLAAQVALVQPTIFAYLQKVCSSS